MKIETMMWLLPIVFMLHDFEEIIMFRPWLDLNRQNLLSRFPKLAKFIFPLYDTISTAGFAFIVMLLFILLTAVTFLAVELELYTLWVGMFMLFFVHLLIHIVSTLVYQKYVPVIITSVLCSIYCVYVIDSLHRFPDLKISDILLWMSLGAAILVLFFSIVMRAAARLEDFLSKRFHRDE